MLHLDEWRKSGGTLANLLLPELWTTCARCARLIYVLLSSLDGSFWTKNPQTLKTAWHLWKWELQNLVPTLMASCRSHGKHMVTYYAGQALQELGLRWPCRQSLDPKRWMPLLRETLGIKTRLIRR